jgi:hypothetical protein
MSSMTEYLCKEITADVVGAYLSIYRATCAYRHEHEPPKLARELISALTKRGREAVEIFPPRRRVTSAKSRPGQSVFLVNGKVIVLVLKVVHLHDREREALEKLICSTSWTVGLALNFGSRSPEFWRAQKDYAQIAVR